MLLPLPSQQTEMWKTLLDLEATQSQPWVLVGGQMTMLHCLENDHPATRAADDGDVVVGVWTRRDALIATSRFLRAREFAEVKTDDGFGYRYKRGETGPRCSVPSSRRPTRTWSTAVTPSATPRTW